MHRYLPACGLTLWMAGALVVAQGAPPPIDIIGVEPLELGDVVTNAPFTAEAVSEMTQELADGNRIERRSRSVVARDSAGRVRREQALPQLGPVAVEPELRLVTISDPGRRALYTIDPLRRTVSSFPMPSGPPGRRGGLGEDRRGGRSRPPPPRIVSENIGSRQIAGTRTDGTRQTMTIPAGVFGNVRPMTVVTERWFSPELKIVIESRTTDPRTGDILYRVVNLERGEPSRELFEVPPDYTVVDRPRPGPGPRPR